MAEDPTTEFTTTYHAAKAGRLAVVTMDNGADHKKPTTFGPAALDSLEAALDAIESAGDVKGLLLTGKPFVFAAGADLKRFVDVDEAFARGAAEGGHAAFKRLADLPFPTLAAINGACLGGGMEIALHCDYRTLSTAAAPLGFPEVFLSIVPGWGGTQLAPRLMGHAGALKVIVEYPLSQNRTMKAAEAHELGLADRLVPAVDFLDASVALLERLVTGEERIERTAPSAGGLDDALAAARALADDKVHGATRAPYVAIDLIEHAARGGDLAEGYRLEEDALAELLPARQAQAAVYSFGLTQQRIRKQPWRPDAQARPVRTVGVVGAGLMGAQLGALLLQRLEAPLVMADVSDDVLAQAKTHIDGELDKRVQRGRLDQGKAGFLTQIVTYSTDTAALAGADLVIEAVPERMGLKQQVFADVEAHVDEAAVLATNTSSLSVAEMSAALAHPERVIGLHFFNPVSVMPLLEIVRPEGAGDEALATGFELSKQLRKSGVLCADTPAFIANRIAIRFNAAAMAALAHGNGFAEIDDAIKALGLPMGPFELFEFVGIAVAHHTMETLHAAYPERFPIDATFQRIAESGATGIYAPDTDHEPRAEVAALVEVAADAEPLTAEAIRTRAVDAVAEEARIMLDEGVVADGRDIDTAALLGLGWPFFVGGPCRYADATGVSDKLFGRSLLTTEDQAFA